MVFKISELDDITKRENKEEGGPYAGLRSRDFQNAEVDREASRRE